MKIEIFIGKVLDRYDLTRAQKTLLKSAIKAKEKQISDECDSLVLGASEKLSRQLTELKEKYDKDVQEVRTKISKLNDDVAMKAIDSKLKPIVGVLGIELKEIKVASENPQKKKEVKKVTGTDEVQTSEKSLLDTIEEESHEQ